MYNGTQWKLLVPQALGNQLHKGTNNFPFLFVFFFSSSQQLFMNCHR